MLPIEYYYYFNVKIYVTITYDLLSIINILSPLLEIMLFCSCHK